MSDDYSTRVASDLCGKEEQLKLHYNIAGERAGRACERADRPGDGAQGDDQHVEKLRRPARLRIRAEGLRRICGTRRRSSSRTTV